MTSLLSRVGKGLKQLGLMGVFALVSLGAAATDISYYHTDHLGTPQAMTDENQNIVWQAEYDPFGQASIITETVTNNIRFPGQYFDAETGLHYNYFRTYDPATGRYITSDPIGLGGGINTFGYVGGNPVVRIDPYGLVEWTGSMNVVSLVTGGGATRLSFELETKCVNGKKGRASVIAGGFAVGFGVSSAGSGSDITFEDNLSEVDPFVFEGGSKFVSAGYAFIGIGYGFSAIQLGGATSISAGHLMGWDASISGGAGISTVVSSSVEECADCD